MHLHPLWSAAGGELRTACGMEEVCHWETSAPWRRCQKEEDGNPAGSIIGDERAGSVRVSTLTMHYCDKKEKKEGDVLRDETTCLTTNKRYIALVEWHKPSD